MALCGAVGEDCEVWGGGLRGVAESQTGSASSHSLTQLTGTERFVETSKDGCVKATLWRYPPPPTDIPLPPFQ